MSLSNDYLQPVSANFTYSRSDIYIEKLTSEQGISELRFEVCKQVRNFGLKFTNSFCIHQDSLSE